MSIDLPEGYYTVSETIEKPELKKDKHTGYVHNCFLMQKPDDEHMFFGDMHDRLHPTLDGYAIVPIEEYWRLKKVAGENNEYIKYMQGMGRQAKKAGGKDKCAR